jgi:hypothetical protein
MCEGLYSRKADKLDLWVAHCNSNKFRVRGGANDRSIDLT